MGLVIDTNFFIDVERKKLSIDNLSTFEEYGDAYIAAITASELLAGVHLAKDIETRIIRSSFVEGVLENIPILDFDEKVARTYAEVFASSLKPKGGNVHDLQIASTAIAHGFKVLTSNTADFNKIPGVKVLSPNSN